MIRRAVVVGGAGAVGRLFVHALAGSGTDVVVLDRQAPPQPAGAGRGAGPRGPRTAVRHGDVLALDPATRAELASTDAVLLALPEAVAIKALPAVLDALAPGTVLVDTLSVKGPYAAALDAVLDGAAAGGDARVQAVGLNPMFAPSLGFPGRPVAGVVYRDGDRVRHLLHLVGGWGARVVRCDPDRHDRLCAAAQALTHAAVLAFGAALTELDVRLAELTDLAPPPHAALLALLARITGQAPEVYWDVQAANPHAEAARTALERGLRRLSETVRTGDELGFGTLLRSLGDLFGSELPGHQDTCARMFTGLATAGRATPTGP